MEVLKDPQFVKFLKKWEQERQASVLSGRANFFNPNLILCLLIEL